MSKEVALRGFGGGGGASLNFDVKAYATEAALLAATPAENTIGVITTTPITGYHFGTEEPSPAAEGMVWITVGTSSQAAFNALKKNSIMVYPVSAKQYVGGAWVDVTCKSYQGGVWVDWRVYLFNYGDTCESLSGGWTNVSGDHLVQNYNGSVSESGTITELKNYSKLYFTYRVTNEHSSGNGNCNFYVRNSSDSNLASWSVAAKTETINAGIQTAVIDISGINVDCYITFSGWYGSAEYYEIWLE